MSDGVPKSRVTLVYDTKQPEGREKPRELPFRLLVLGDVGGDKGAPLDQRKVRQLNGRNLGEVIKGLRVEVRDIDLGEVPATAANGSAGGSSASSSSSGGGAASGGSAAGSGSATSGAGAASSSSAAASSSAGSASSSGSAPSANGATPATNGSRPKARVRIDSIASFSPDEVLKLLTGQKAEAPSVDPVLANAWGVSSAREMWPGDEHLSALWKRREQVVGFQKSYQNSKTLRAALKRFSVPPAESDPNSPEVTERKQAIAKMKKEIASALAQAKATT